MRPCARRHGNYYDFMIVTEIRQYRVQAETKEEALAKRRAGEGELVASQDVANVEGKTGVTSIFPTPVPLDQWPLWAKTMRQFAKPEDRGIGDVVAHMIGEEKSEAFKAWFEATFHRPCGCNGRRSEWNLKYPL